MDDDDFYVDWDDEYPDIDDYGEGEEGVYIKLHGGACCGIKHIHYMGCDPTGMLAARLELTGTGTSYGRYAVNGVNDAHADTYPQDFFCEAAPAETRIARLDRLLTFLKEKRPHGIVEIVLTSSQHLWYKPLKDRGFVKVTEAKNSNTSNQLRVFHLAY